MPDRWKHQEEALEVWAPVIGYEGRYQASSLGRICNIRRDGKVLKARPDKDGYLYVALGGGRGKLRDHKVHRLVLESFTGPCPRGKQAAHADGNPANNRLENLRWATPRENSADKRAHGTQPRKISPDVVREIRRLRGKVIQRDLARRFGISEAQVCRIQLRRQWGWLSE
jgi:hypothetical protein